METFDEDGKRKRRAGGVALLVGILVLLMLALGWYWSRTPDVQWIQSEVDGQPAPTGYASADALIHVIATLLDKPGGYLSNDVTPPSVFLDNIPSFEYGAIIQARDFSRAMRNDFTRSQTQSMEDRDLAVAEPALNFNHRSWLFPRTETQYRDALKAVQRYQVRLLNDEGEFFSRADNLRNWLITVEKRLGNLSQQLTASVGQRRVNTNLAGNRTGSATSADGVDVIVKTPWLELDNVYYESRGSAWALIHFLRAAELDFADVLEDKNATISLRQVIRELEATQQSLMSPVVLNGSGFGIFANHSLVMASYLSRANAAVIDLRELLGEG